MSRIFILTQNTLSIWVDYGNNETFSCGGDLSNTGACWTPGHCSLHGGEYATVNLTAFTLHVSQVNVYFRTIIQNSTRLQYTIELYMHRMVSTLPLSSDPPLASRLEILRDRENAWKRLEWKRKCSLDTIPCDWTFKLANGVLGSVSCSQSIHARSINFFELPSGDSAFGDVTRAWTHSMGDLPVTDFAMDPAQDLLALVVKLTEEYVRLRIFCL